jgi:hypothetical protein
MPKKKRARSAPAADPAEGNDQATSAKGQAVNVVLKVDKRTMGGKEREKGFVVCRAVLAPGLTAAHLEKAIVANAVSVSDG